MICKFCDVPMTPVIGGRLQCEACGHTVDMPTRRPIRNKVDELNAVGVNFVKVRVPIPPTYRKTAEDLAKRLEKERPGLLLDEPLTVDRVFQMAMCLGLDELRTL